MVNGSDTMNEIKIKKCPVCESTRWDVYMGEGYCKRCNYRIKLFKADYPKNI